MRPKRPENAGVPRNRSCRDSLIGSFPFLTFGAACVRPACAKPSAALPAGSYWYATFRGSPGSTSRDKTDYTRPERGPQHRFREMSRLPTNGCMLTLVGRSRALNGSRMESAVERPRPRAFERQNRSGEPLRDGRRTLVASWESAWLRVVGGFAYLRFGSREPQREIRTIANARVRGCANLRQSDPLTRSHGCEPARRHALLLKRSRVADEAVAVALGIRKFVGVVDRPAQDGPTAPGLRRHAGARQRVDVVGDEVGL